MRAPGSGLGYVVHGGYQGAFAPSRVEAFVTGGTSSERGAFAVAAERTARALLSFARGACQRAGVTAGAR